MPCSPYLSFYVYSIPVHAKLYPLALALQLAGPSSSLEKTFVIQIEGEL